MPRATTFALLCLGPFLLATPAPAAETVVYPLLYEGGLPLSIGTVQGLGVAPGDTLAVEIDGLTVRGASVETAQGEVVDTSAWSFAVGGRTLTRLTQEGQPLRYVAPVEQAFCGSAITSEQLPAPIPVACTGETDGGGDVTGAEQGSPGSGDAADGGTRPAPQGRAGLRVAGDFDPEVRCGYDRRQHLATLCFDRDGIPYRPPAPGVIDDNDLLAVYLLVPEDGAQRYSVSVQGTINDQSIRLEGAGGLSGLRQVLGQLQDLADEELRAVLAGEFGPFQAPSFTVTVSGPNGLQRATSFTVNPTYTASLRFAVGESDLRFNDFAVRQFADGESRIQNVAADGGEARELLTVVFYGWPWQERFWNGRDLRKPPASLGERINPMLGLGLTDVGDEYAAGISVELARGFDAFAAIHFAEVEQLAGGFAEGDAFSGDASTLPTRASWEDDVIFGLSVDLRIAAEVLGSLLGGGG